MKHALKIAGVALLSLVAVLLTLSAFFYSLAMPSDDITWGINFSTKYARGFGYEPEELLNQSLGELKPKHMRLATYWDEIEPMRGQYDFQETDNLIDIAEKYNVGVLLVLGRKQPRWPECHDPSWLKELTPENQDTALAEKTTALVNRYKERDVIIGWQIENEALFHYGENCPVSSTKKLGAQVDLVRSLDNTREIIATDSGEKGAWLPTAWSGADLLGATMYREVYHGEKGKYLTYPLPPLSYNVKAGIVRFLSSTDKVIGVELQAEPWFMSDALSTPIPEHLEHMNPEIFADNIKYATSVGFEQNYFWGTEWWYWMAKQGEPEMLDAAKQFFAEQQ